MKFEISKKSDQQKFFFILLGFFWIVTQAALFWQRGIETGFEAIKYINEAQNFIQFGKLTSNNFWLYSTEIFLIAVVIKLHLNFMIIVVVQWLLNLFATWMFYQLAVFILKKPVLAFLATFIFIINITYQVYNSFLFTESVFYSLTVIYSSYLLRIQKLNLKNIGILVLLLILLSVTRPTGILFFPATAIYIFFRFLKPVSVWYQSAIIIGSLIIFYFLINQMLQSGGEFDFMLPFRKENIICGVNTNRIANIDVMEKGNSIEGLVYYILHNKDQFLRLAKLKTISFFGFTRSYYSPMHNLYLMAFFYPIYILSIIGAVKMILKKQKALIYLFIIILLYWITTLLTCDDWHNRFILTVSPFIFLIAVASFTFSKNRKESLLSH
ncbi:MAG TPA: hypothetical protein VN722_00080 [Hanamia sp.]|nr:hypothetical protein [Hanamia sp.]